MVLIKLFLLFFFFNDTATTEIYTLSLHDALPISWAQRVPSANWVNSKARPWWRESWRWCAASDRDRKSTRLNSSHGYISYAVFCLKKKTYGEIDIFHGIDKAIADTWSNCWQYAQT